MKTDSERYDDELGETLRIALREHELRRRDDFAEKMLVRLSKQRQQEILAEVILQERLALAGLIALPIVAVVVILFFSEAVIGVSGWLRETCDAVLQSALGLTDQWQLWMVAVLAVGVAVYGVVDLIVTQE